MHAMIEVTGPDEIYIIDLGSASGTFVNGQRSNKARLQNGDEIVVGETRLDRRDRCRRSKTTAPMAVDRVALGVDFAAMAAEHADPSASAPVAHAGAPRLRPAAPRPLACQAQGHAARHAGAGRRLGARRPQPASAPSRRQRAASVPPPGRRRIRAPARSRSRPVPAATRSVTRSQLRPRPRRRHPRSAGGAPAFAAPSYGAAGAPALRCAAARSS